MSNQDITYLTIGVCALFVVVAYVTLIVVPAWSAYSRAWERMAATFLSLYALVAFIALGLAGGAAIIWFWDRIVG